jgi:hypothetical protein
MQALAEWDTHPELSTSITKAGVDVPVKDRTGCNLGFFVIDFWVRCSV